LIPFSEFPIRLRILLPFLAAVALLLSPRAAGIDQILLNSTLAKELRQTQLEADRQWIVIQFEPWRFGLLSQTGRLALQAGNFNLAIRILERARQLGVLEPQGVLALGEAYWASEDQSKAIQTWEQLLKEGRAPSEVYEKVVWLLRTTGQLADAAQWAQIWWQTYSQNGRAAYTWGILNLAFNGDLSLTVLEKAAQLDPGWGEQTSLLIQVMTQIDVQSPIAYRWIEIGRGLGNVGEWELALAAFERAKVENPAYAEAWAFSSEAKIRLRQDGLPDLQRAEELAPNSAAIQALMAVNYRRSGNSQEALQHFLVVAALEPRRAIWQTEIGNSYADLHNVQKGLEYYRKALEIEPENPEVWRWMAQYCLQHALELRGVGLPAARQAVVLAPSDPANLDLLGLLLNALDDGPNAERIWQRAIEKAPDFSATLLHLGQFYMLQGRLDWCEYYLSRAAQLPGQDTESSLLARRLLARYFAGR
jgi:tetratricopeptide (TPR) repeat protein